MEFSQWRVVLNLLDEKDGLDVPGPRFEEDRHAGVCSEVCQASIISMGICSVRAGPSLSSFTWL